MVQTYMMLEGAFPGHLSLVHSHLALENQAAASLIQMSCACLAEQLTMEVAAAVVGVAIVGQVLEVTVEWVEEIGAVDFEEAFQHSSWDHWDQQEGNVEMAWA